MERNSFCRARFICSAAALSDIAVAVLRKASSVTPGRRNVATSGRLASFSKGVLTQSSG